MADERGPLQKSGRRTEQSAERLGAFQHGGISGRIFFGGGEYRPWAEECQTSDGRNRALDGAFGRASSDYIRTNRLVNDKVPRLRSAAPHFARDDKVEDDGVEDDVIEDGVEDDGVEDNGVETAARLPASGSDLSAGWLRNHRERGKLVWCRNIRLISRLISSALEVPRAGADT